MFDHDTDDHIRENQPYYKIDKVLNNFRKLNMDIVDIKTNIL